MKIQKECLPCLLKRILFETELSTTDKLRQVQTARLACRLLAELYNPAVCSATIATQVHKEVYESLQDPDPYKNLKTASNRTAMALLPKIKACLKSSDDRLKSSMLCAIIGNMMDFGIEGSSTHPQMLQQVFDRLYDEGLGHDDYDRVKKLLRSAKKVVVFTDNCGEIVFDKILCQELKEFNPQLYITVVVKGEPVLSDATMEDATLVTFDEVVDEVVTTGCFAVGVDFCRLPGQVKESVETADVIIAKGMANYESFSETSYRPVVYLLRTKCAVIARSMGLAQDISVIKLYE
jgi:uncharacterized protein with ATP-grasp and redox domains